MTSLNSPLPPSMRGHYAGFATRLLAFVLDVLIISTIVVFVSWFVTATVNMVMGQIILDSLIQRIPTIDTLTRIATHPLTHSLVSVAFIISYYLFFWTLIGQTPGKYLMGIRVVTVQGNRLKVGRSLLRYLGYYVSGLCLGLGFLWILFDDERRAWHDRLAGTCVIYVWDARPDEKFLVKVTDELVHRREALRALIRHRRDRHGSEK